MCCWCAALHNPKKLYWLWLKQRTFQMCIGEHDIFIFCRLDSSSFIHRVAMSDDQLTTLVQTTANYWIDCICHVIWLPRNLFLVIPSFFPVAPSSSQKYDLSKTLFCPKVFPSASVVFCVKFWLANISMLTWETLHQLSINVSHCIVRMLAYWGHYVHILICLCFFCKALWTVLTYLIGTGMAKA